MASKSSQKKQEDIRQEYVKLHRQGLSSGQIIKSLMKTYYLNFPRLYQILDLPTLRKQHNLKPRRTKKTA